MIFKGIGKIINGDCLDVMRKIPDNFVDCVICDLPYGCTKCKWDIVIPMDELWELYNRIVKPQGSILLFGNEPFQVMLEIVICKIINMIGIGIR